MEELTMEQLKDWEQVYLDEPWMANSVEEAIARTSHILYQAHSGKHGKRLGPKDFLPISFNKPDGLDDKLSDLVYGGKK